MSNSEAEGGPHWITSHIAARSLNKRRELGFTQEEVAKHLNVSVNEVSAYEGGRVRMTPQIKFRLSSLYKVSPEWFYEGLEESGAGRLGI